MTDYAPQANDPEDANSEPVPPLAKATEWATVTLDLGDGEQTYRRELNVMPQWAGSCWYELRYLDPTNDKAFCRPRCRAVLDGQGPGPAQRHRRRRPVRRRRRARRAAPAVLPVLAQGAVRPGPRDQRGAVPPAVQPGLHPGFRLHRRARRVRAGRGGRRGDPGSVHPPRPPGEPGVREDGQVAEQRRHPRRHVRLLRRRRLPDVRDGHGPAGHLASVADPRRGRLPAVPAATVARGGRRVHRRGHRHRRGAGPGNPDPAAPHHRRGPHRLRRDGLQHRRRQADRADQPPDQGRAPRCRARWPSRWC